MTDYSLYADLLTRLQAATSEQEKDWMVTEFGLNQLPPPVRDAVWAAAIPHQFDRGFLGFLLIPLKRNRWKDFFYSYIAKFLGKSFREQAQRYFHGLTEEEFKTLLSQSYIEHLWDGGYAVHESTRKLLLAKLYQDNPQRYRKLNHRAAIYCEQQNQNELRWRVATLYHQVLADLDGSADEINRQAWDWHNDRLQLDKVEALIRPLLEEVKAQRVSDAVTAQVFLFQGVLDDFYGRRFKAKEYLTQAIQLFQQLQDKLNAAESILRLGVVHLSLSDYEAARTQCQQALRLFRQIGEKRGEANCIFSLGNVHLNLAEYEAARTQYQQALPLYQQIGNKWGGANCTKRLGQVIAEQGQIDNAIATLKHATELYHAIGLIVDEADCFDSIANIYHDQKRYEDTLLAYQHALEIAPEGGYWYHNRARTYIAMEQYDLALQDIERAEKTGTYLEYLQAFRGVIALWQHQPQTAVDLLQSATQQRPQDGDFQRPLALALLANGNAEAFTTMETGLKLTYRKKDIEGTLEELDKLVRIYGERAEFAQMRTLITDDLAQRFPEK